MIVCALARFNYSLQLLQTFLRADHRASPSPSISPNRSTSSASFFTIFHLIFQLLVLGCTHPSGKSGPYQLKVNGRVIGRDHH